MRPNTLETVLARIDVGDCWVWSGTHDRDGYGEVQFGGRRRYVHRLILELLVFGRSLPSWLVVDHLCRRRDCCNPDHLRVCRVPTNTLAGYGPSALNARRDHCVNGHEFTTENTYWYGRRVCRQCIFDRQRARRARLKAA